jgi:hypothetical protein
VNEVRMSAAACSLTTPIRRFQQMSSVIGSITVPPWPTARRSASGGRPP